MGACSYGRQVIGHCVIFKLFFIHPFIHQFIHLSIDSFMHWALPRMPPHREAALRAYGQWAVVDKQGVDKAAALVRVRRGV